MPGVPVAVLVESDPGCDNCGFAQGDDVPAGWQPGDPLPRLTCRRHPPTPAPPGAPAGDAGTWPVVEPWQWCGEWVCYGCGCVYRPGERPRHRPGCEEAYDNLAHNPRGRVTPKAAARAEGRMPPLSSDQRRVFQALRRSLVEQRPDWDQHTISVGHLLHFSLVDFFIGTDPHMPMAPLFGERWPLDWLADAHRAEVMGRPAPPADDAEAAHAGDEDPEPGFVPTLDDAVQVLDRILSGAVTTWAVPSRRQGPVTWDVGAVPASSPAQEADPALVGRPHPVGDGRWGVRLPAGTAGRVGLEVFSRTESEEATGAWTVRLQRLIEDADPDRPDAGEVWAFEPVAWVADEARA